MIKVSDYIIKFIESKKVKDVFTISGGGCMHLIDSLKLFKAHLVLRGDIYTKKIFFLNFNTYE